MFCTNIEPPAIKRSGIGTLPFALTFASLPKNIYRFGALALHAKHSAA